MPGLETVIGLFAGTLAIIAATPPLDQSPCSTPEWHERNQILATSAVFLREFPIFANGVEQIGERVLTTLEKFANTVFYQFSFQVNRLPGWRPAPSRSCL